MLYPKTCTFCHTAFETTQSKQVYCSRQCFHQAVRQANDASMQKVCPFCKTAFRAIESQQKFCSIACARKAYSNATRTQVTLTCANCGRPFQVKRAKADKARYCSRECHAEAMSRSGRVALICKICGRSFERLASRTGDYCSYTCMGMDKRSRVTLACTVCGKTFTVTTVKAETARYCSRQCQNLGKISQVTITCAVCGEDFDVPQCRAGDARYCSWECYRIGWKPNRVSSSELAVKDALDNLGISYEVQYPVARLLIDFYLPTFHIALEVDGVYWHNLPGRPEQDADRDDRLRSLGITPVHVTDIEVEQASDLPSLILAQLKIRA